MMKRKMKKISRLIICSLMALALAAVPAFAARVAVTVEKLPLGEGFIVAPELVELSEGDDGESVLIDLLVSRNIYFQSYTDPALGFYLSAIRDPSNGKLLGMSFENMAAGWMYTVNNVFPNKSAGFYDLSDGDVMRWQYTEDWGADIGGNVEILGTGSLPDKDALIWKVAEMNAAGNNSGETYENALAVLEDINATAEQIETALAALNDDTGGEGEGEGGNEDESGGGNGGGGEPPTVDIKTETVPQKEMVSQGTVISNPKYDTVEQAKNAKLFETSGELQAAIEEGTVPDIAEFISAESGVVTANKDALLDGLEHADSGDEKVSVDEEKTIPLPIVTAELPSGKETAIITFRLNMDELAGSPFGDVLVIKQKNDALHTSEILARVEGNDPAAITSGRFVFTDEHGTAIPTDYEIKAQEVYYLNVGIEDGSFYDWDEAPGRILDPMALSEKSTETDETTSSSGSGGCNAGFGVRALLALALMAGIHRRKE